jgi:hypothetical protein
MNLSQYIKENPTKNLAEVQAVPIPLDKVYNSNEMSIILAFNDLYLYFKNHIGEFQTAFYDRVKTESNFDFRDSSADGQVLQGMLAIMIATEQDVTFNANLVNLQTVLIGSANSVIYPFSNVTQPQLDSAKGIYSSRSINLVKGKDIKLTLNTDLTEKVAATTWLVEQGFENENMGKSVHIKNINSYRIRSGNLSSGAYEIRIPASLVDFTVELI